MKIAIALSCLLALASARSALKLREEGSSEMTIPSGRPVTAEDGRQFIDRLLEFGGKIHGHIQSLDAEAKAIGEGKDINAAGKAARGILNNLISSDKEAQEIMGHFGKGIKNLMFHGVEGLNDCRHLAYALHMMVKAAQAKEQDEEFWGKFLLVTRGNVVCISARFEGFGGYLKGLKEDMEEGEQEENRRRLRRDLASLLRDFEGGHFGPRPTGDGSESGEHGPRPTGDGGRGDRHGPRPTGDGSESGEHGPRPAGGRKHRGGKMGGRKGGRTGPKPTAEKRGENPYEGMSGEEIAKRLRFTAMMNFKIEADCAVVYYGMLSLHGWVSHLVHNLNAIVPQQFENREVAALRSLLLKAHELNAAMNNNMHLLR